MKLSKKVSNNIKKKSSNLINRIKILQIKKQRLERKLKKYKNSQAKI